MKKRRVHIPQQRNQETQGGVGEGDRTAFQNSTIGPKARMNLKGKGRGHEDGDKGREAPSNPNNSRNHAWSLRPL